MAIYHYATRSRTEFSDKVERGPAHGKIGKTIEFFEAVDALANDTCLDAIKDPVARQAALLPLVRAAPPSVAVRARNLQNGTQDQESAPDSAVPDAPVDQQGLAAVSGEHRRAEAPGERKVPRRVLRRFATRVGVKIAAGRP